MLDKNLLDSPDSMGRKVNPSGDVSRGSGGDEILDKEHLIEEDAADRDAKVKASGTSSRAQSGAVSFVDKSKYGVTDIDEVDDALAGLIVDKTP